MSNKPVLASLLGQPATLRSFKRSSAETVRNCIKQLEKVLPSPKQVSTKPSLLNRRSHDYSYHEHHLPDAVVTVDSEEQIVAVLKTCNSFKVPVIPLAGGTSLEAHTVPTEAGGIILDTSSMDKVLALHEQDMDVIVQPGIGWVELREYLEPHGLFFPPDPGAAACIGGMCGTNCSGTLAYRYGTMKDNVMSLRVVLADGTVVQTRRRAVKSSAGYDLTRLFVGSEGTLGVTTAATLRLRRKPTHTAIAIAQFPDILAASSCVHALVLSGMAFQRLELIDAPCVRAVNKHDIPDPTKRFQELPTLLAECVGFSERGRDEQWNVFEGVVKTHRGSNARVALDVVEAEKLWDLRKKAYFAASALRPESPTLSVLTTDVAVPISKLGVAMEAASKMLEKYKLTGPMVAHAGDGNFHCLLVIDTANKEEVRLAEVVREELGVLALGLDGTVTGEHGVGMGKRELLTQEVGKEAIALMKLLKRTIDPNNILNPGKVLLPDETSSKL